MRLGCWENLRVPAEIYEIAKYLGYDITGLEKALTVNVKAFLLEKDGSFYCPELDDYRQHIEEHKNKQSEGGKRGAASKNGKANKPVQHVNTTDAGVSQGNLQAPYRGSLSSLVKSRSAKQSQAQSLESGVINDKWVYDYEKASNGS